MPCWRPCRRRDRYRCRRRRLPAAPRGGRVIETPRAPWPAAANREFPVPPPPDEGAAELFTPRPQAPTPSFARSGRTGGAAAEISPRLEGLPLAIELAA